MSFVAHLAADSLLRRAFPQGVAPITSPTPETAMFDGKTEQLYYVDTAVLSSRDRHALAELMSSEGWGTYEQCRRALWDGVRIPVRAKNVTGVSFPPRLAPPL